MFTPSLFKFSGEEPHYKENMDQVEQRAEK